MARKNAISVTREQDFAAWYQAVIQEAGMAEESGVRGCMIMLPWGYGIWERIQQLLDRRIKETGHQNCYFPLFIPLSYIAREADHVDGFAKEMAVVTHHRLKTIDGELTVDPEAKLEEPLVVRPTSETVIGTAFSRWLQSWRDLPIMINQWANVVRWEMRTRMFLRTSEFLWQEGHTAHATGEEALEETLTILDLYRDFAQGPLAMPVIAGEKPEHERFPGADATYSIEAMMQDGKALQAGTSHFLGQNFSKAQNIRFQDREGVFQNAYTTSWGVSTRLVGGVIMTHGDDDGLRVPPEIAPHQIVIIPMLRDQPEDDELLDYCEALRVRLIAQSAFGEPVRVLLDKKPGKAAQKRWSWVKKGAPVIVEIGKRDAEQQAVTVLRRDALYNADDKLASETPGCDAFVASAPALLADIQQTLFDQANKRLHDHIRTNIHDLQALADHFNGKKYPSWVLVPWARPSGAELDKVEQLLKGMKLTIRNAPRGDDPVDGPCFFTGKPAVERVLVARAY
ncbi:MAG: proline--tRNA ligase [Blastomonas sp.]